MLDLNLQQILCILGGRYKLVLALMATVVAATWVVCMILPMQYTATTTVVVDTKSPDPVATALSTTTSTAVGNYTLSIGTEAEIIASPRVLWRAVKVLKLDENDEVKTLWRNDTGGLGSIDVWLAELLLKKLSVKTTTTSNVVSIKFVGSDPEFAALVANTVAKAYIDVNLELKIEPAKQYAAWFAEQESVLRDALEKAQARVSQFQAERSLVASVEQQDIETTTLADLERQLTTALGQAAEVQSKVKAGEGAEGLPEVLQNQFLSGLKGDLARQEAKLQEAAGNLGRNHPQYQRMEREIEALQEKLGVETKRFVDSFGASQAAINRRVAELRVAIEAQKRKLLRLKTDRDQLAVLLREVDAAKKALDLVASRTTQANLASQGNQVQVSVLTPAVAPLEPSSPKTLLYTLLSIPGGLMLGALGAFALEQYDQRIRSREDLAGTSPVPVLGVIERRRAPEEARLHLLRRSLSGWLPFLRRAPPEAAR